MHKDIVLSKKPELEDPYLIASWPGMGEVAIRAASYLKDKLQAEMFGFILPKNYFNPVGAWVERNLIQSAQLPQSQFFYWKNPKGTNDLIFFLCESQPPLEKGYLFAERVLEVAKEFKVKRIFTFAACPQPIDHTQEPGVWATATSPKILEELKDFKVKFMNSGQIAGLNGLLLSVAKDKKMEGVCLLGEIPIYTIQIENPKASLAILEVMIEILDIEIDLSELAQRARFIEEEIENAVIETVKVNRVLSGYIRPIAFIGEGEMGLYAYNNPVHVAIAVWPWGTYLGEEGLKNGVRVKISSIQRHHPNSAFTKAKICGYYVNSILAKKEARENSYDEAILLDTEGFISEGAGENIFIVKNGIVKTPLAYSILPGITRKITMMLLEEFG
ncbi:MAG: PAC2 family protein, partial [Candidatus Omnitrophota bacterium]